LLVFLVLASVAPAADWPQWLGPQRDASTPEKVAPWKGSLQVLWRQPVGEGNSAPVVAGGRVYLHTKNKDKLEEQLAAYDAVSGKPLWQTAYARPALNTLYGNGPRATPAIADGRIFTYGITGLLTCFDAGTGNKVWQVDTDLTFNPPHLLFGASCSPLVDKNMVLINVGGKGASVVAFAAESGKVLWKNLDDGASYSSPIVFGEAKERQAVFLTRQGLVSVELANGELLWRVPFKDLILESSTTPVHAGDVLVASSITLGSIALRLEKKNGKFAANRVWEEKPLTCYFSTPVAVGNAQLYAVTGVNPLTDNPFAKKKTSATLRCLELSTGKELWAKANVGTYHASLLRTGNDKLLMLEERGELVLLDPNPKEYRELARSKICGDTWAHPAVANGRLYVRDGKELMCVQLSTAPAR
jgi:outer membrane protein assembly factor BamB